MTVLPDRKLHFNIAIDGPSGAGKSTLAKMIAASLGIPYVDTGAIYRTVGYAVRERGIDPDDAEAVASMLPSVRVKADFTGGVQQMILDGRPLGELIRNHEISSYASKVSAHPAVRAFLLEMQRDIARKNSVVMDGRDIGTVILPDAEVKIFLSAGDECRARRRFDELRASGSGITFEKVLSDIRERDRRDSSRDTAPLRPADDAVLLDNTLLDAEATLRAALGIIRQKVPGAAVKS